MHNYRISYAFLGTFLFLVVMLSSGCNETRSERIASDGVGQVEQAVAKKVLVSKHEVIELSSLLGETKPQSERLEIGSNELTVTSGHQLIKFTKDNKIVALSDGKVLLTENRSKKVYQLDIESNNLATAFLNIKFIDLQAGITVMGDTLMVGKQYAVGVSSRFPLKPGSIKLMPSNETFIFSSEYGDVFITPSPNDLSSDKETYLLRLEVNGREYAKYFRLQAETIEGVKLITDTQNTILPIGASIEPLVSYVDQDGGVRHISPSVLTYVVSEQLLTLEELQNYLSDEKNVGQHTITVQYPGLQDAQLNYEMLPLDDFITKFGLALNLPKVPQVLNIHAGIPYRLKAVTNGIDVTSLIHFEVSPPNAGNIENGLLSVTDSEVNAFVVSPLIEERRSLVAEPIPSVSAHYSVVVDRGPIKLRDDVGDRLQTRQTVGNEGFPLRLLINDVNVAGREIRVGFLNSKGEYIVGSREKSAWSTCGVSFSEPDGVVLHGETLYGVPAVEIHEALMTFDCREREYMDVNRAIDHVAFSSLGVSEVVNLVGKEQVVLELPKSNGVYELSYDKFGRQSSVPYDIRPYLKGLFNHPTRDAITTRTIIKGSESVLVDSNGKLKFLSTYRPTGDIQLHFPDLDLTYRLDVGLNHIAAEQSYVYKNKEFGSYRLAKEVVLNGKTLVLKDSAFYRNGRLALSVTAPNEQGEEVSVGRYVRFVDAANQKDEQPAEIASGGNLVLGDLDRTGQYRFDVLTKDFRRVLSSIIIDVVDSEQYQYKQGPSNIGRVPAGSIGRLAFKRKDGTEYEIYLNKTTFSMAGFWYMANVFKDIVSKSGGNILPVDMKSYNNPKDNEHNIIGVWPSGYRNGFALSESLLVNLEEPVSYEFEIRDATGAIIYHQSR